MAPDLVGLAAEKQFDRADAMHPTTINLAALCVFAAQAANTANAAADEPVSVRVSLSADTIRAGGDLTAEVVVSSLDGERRRFRIGGFAEYFGVYILGPWGPVQPDPMETRPENWMHGQHQASREVVIEENKPLVMKFKLTDFFHTGRPTSQLPAAANGLSPGKHQMNIKFFGRRIGLAKPVDSGPIFFTVIDVPAAAVPEDQMSCQPSNYALNGSGG